jgi:hypothetical protein
LIAPFKAIEALEKGLTDDFDADIRLEARLFAECAVSDIAKNLIGIFSIPAALGACRDSKVRPVPDSDRGHGGAGGHGQRHRQSALAQRLQSDAVGSQ